MAFSTCPLACGYLELVVCLRSHDSALFQFPAWNMRTDIWNDFIGYSIACKGGFMLGVYFRSSQCCYAGSRAIRVLRLLFSIPRGLSRIVLLVSGLSCSGIIILWFWKKIPSALWISSLKTIMVYNHKARYSCGQAILVWSALLQSGDVGSGVGSGVASWNYFTFSLQLEGYLPGDGLASRFSLRQALNEVSGLQVCSGYCTISKHLFSWEVLHL